MVIEQPGEMKSRAVQIYYSNPQNVYKKCLDGGQAGIDEEDKKLQKAELKSCSLRLGQATHRTCSVSERQ